MKHGENETFHLFSKAGVCGQAGTHRVAITGNLILSHESPSSGPSLAEYCGVYILFGCRLGLTVSYWVIFENGLMPFLLVFTSLCLGDLPGTCAPFS